MDTNENRTQWHPGFCAAMQLELYDNRDDLEYHKEFNLNRKPLQIDLLIITKKETVSIKNQIGHIFSKYNIMEYKSPRDSLDIDTFYKVQAYACLYKNSGNKINIHKAGDITVSLIRHRYPQNLMKLLRAEGFTITKPYPGIYYVSGKLMFQTQIIISSRLEHTDHIWLTSLTEQIKRHRYSELLNATDILNNKDEKECADAVIDVISNANAAMIRQWKESDKMIPSLERIMAPEIAQWKLQARNEGMRIGIDEGKCEGKREGKIEGRIEGRIEGILEGRIIAYAELGLSIAEISEKTKLSKDAIQQILDKQQE
ncbi:MAG: hypothetical protein HFJ06_05725 [Lachnospiraceae bacterium]|nr:hypothetical protein [Lachnospiraceae bacterium]